MQNSQKPIRATNIFLRLLLNETAPILRYTGAITPQAIFSPELPAGCEVKSSGLRCIITTRLSISRMLNLSVSTDI